MAAKVGLSVEVQGDDIVVTLPGTSYVVTYYRATAFPQQLSPNPTQAERIRMPR
jgi:hypothetical protein